MSMRVLQPGTFSLLVDLGRPSSRGLGVPVGGAADRAAYALGNALVGNGHDEIALEIALSGPTLVAEHDVSACLFGAPFALEIDGRPVDAGRVFQLRAGQILKIAGTRSGACAYLCVHGGFQSKRILGSGSALTSIAAGDCLPCGESFGAGRSLASADAATLLDESAEADILHFVDGPQADWFPAERFDQRTYSVSPASNRMGVRLQGEPLPRSSRELVSEALAPGAVQITNDGLPIVLGVDGQTIGGYPKIAHVIRADLDRIAQLRPSQTIRFVRVDLDEADARAQSRRRKLRRWLTALRLAAE